MASFDWIGRGSKTKSEKFWENTFIIVFILVPVVILIGLGILLDHYIIKW